jgi:hypothetical protein
MPFSLDRDERICDHIKKALFADDRQRSQDIAYAFFSEKELCNKIRKYLEANLSLKIVVRLESSTKRNPKTV